jgi:hypothetical protein
MSKTPALLAIRPRTLRTNGSAGQRYHWPLAASSTKRVEFDGELLDRLHRRRPEMSDRELLESMARMTLGRETLRRVQERNTLSEDEAIELGIKAVHEARHDRRAAG